MSKIKIGSTHNRKTRMKISQTRKKRIKQGKIKIWDKDNLKFSNWKNPFWKGDKVGYVALHKWVKKRKIKPKLCGDCHKKKRLDLANISGEYKRNINDYRYLCKKCHSKFDNIPREIKKKFNLINGRYVRK